MNNRKWKWGTQLAALSGALLLSISGQVLAVDKALIIGVGKFKIPSINLPGIDLDVNMAKDIAIYMGIRPENTHIIMDEQATYARVREEMKSWLGKGVSVNDRVFIYISSHGTLIADKDNDEPDGKSEAVVLHDIDAQTFSGIYDDDDVGADLKQIPSQNVVVMIDTCHSGTMTKSLNFEGNSFNVRKGKSKFINLFDLSSKKIDHGLVGSNKKDLELENTSENASTTDNYVAFSAAQDNQSSIATEKGSMFTVAFRDSFDTERGKNTPPTLKGVYLGAEARLKESGASFQPNISGNKSISERAFRVADNNGEGSARNGPLWKDISELAEQMPQMEINAPTTRIDGEPTEFVVNIPSDGYLNIVMIGPKDNGTVLFPNSYHTDNRVLAGKMNFPTTKMPFKITARPPYGKTLLAVFVTKEKVNLLEEGFGNRDSTGKSVKPFAHITRSGMKSLNKATRDLGISAKDEPVYWGGKSEIEIKGR